MFPIRFRWNPTWSLNTTPRTDCPIILQRPPSASLAVFPLAAIRFEQVVVAWHRPGCTLPDWMANLLAPETGLVTELVGRGQERPYCLFELTWFFRMKPVTRTGNAGKARFRKQDADTLAVVGLNVRAVCPR